MSIREIPAAAITDAVEALCIEANTRLPADVKAALDAAEAVEPWPLAKETLGLLQQNLCVAKRERPAYLPGHRHGLRLYRAGPGRSH